MEGALPLERPARRRREGRRRLGVDDAAHPRRRDRRRSRRGRRARGAARVDDRVGEPMPELPEVETVARDLRPKIVGATITGARCTWATHAAHAHARGIRGGDRRPASRGRDATGQARRRRAVGRRRPDDPPQDDRPAVRRPGRRAGGPVRPAGPRAGRRPRGAVPRHPQVRQGRPVRAGPRDGRSRDGGRRIRRVRGVRPRTTRGRPSRVRDFRRGLRRRSGRLKPLLLDQSFIAGIGNIYADEALWAARLHPLRTVGTLRRPDERRLYERDPVGPCRGGRATGQLDRRLHGARRRWLDAGAARGLPANGRAVPALWAARPAGRGRRSRDTFLLVVPASPGQRPKRRCGDPRDA